MPHISTAPLPSLDDAPSLVKIAELDDWKRTSENEPFKQIQPQTWQFVKFRRRAACLLQSWATRVPSSSAR